MDKPINPNERVVHPSHYNKGIEMWDYSHSHNLDFFEGNGTLEPTIIDTKEEFNKTLDFPEFDFSDVKGQESIKRCMEIAAAGGHNIIIMT